MSTIRNTHSLLTREQILDLAQHPPNRRNAQRFAQRLFWQQLSIAPSGSELYGLFPIKNKEPYQTSVQVSYPTFSCTCTKTRYPCVHGLALYLLWLENAKLFAEDAIPPWADKLPSEGNHDMTTATEYRLPATGEVEQHDAYAAQRLQNAQDGLKEVAARLRELVTHGMADLPNRPRAFWQQMGARLADAQAGGLVPSIKQMAATVGAGTDWPEQLLAQMGCLHLLAAAVQRFETLSFPEQNDLALALGWQPHWSTTHPPQPLRDVWHVLGREDEHQGKRILQRHWLWGEESNCAARLETYVHRGARIDTRLPTGRAYDATLAFYPTTKPLRAEVIEYHAPRQPLHALDGFATVAEALLRYRQTLAQTPWLDLFPLYVPIVDIEQETDQCWLVDQTQHVIPVANTYLYKWQLLALIKANRSQEGLRVFGLWNGMSLQPLSVWQDGRILTLSWLKPVLDHPLARGGV